MDTDIVKNLIKNEEIEADELAEIANLDAAYADDEALPEEKSVGGISFRVIARFVAVVTACVVVAIIFSIRNVSVRHSEQQTASNNYYVVSEAVDSLWDASNYLTEEARAFIISENPEHAVNYITEANVTKRREKAIETVKGLNNSDLDSATRLLEAALVYSNRLEQTELYAMKLEACSIGLSEDEIPAVIWNYDLPASEELVQKYEELFSKEPEAAELTAGEMDDMAFELLFDDNYSAMKDEIQSKVSDASEAILSIVREEQEAASESFRKSLIQLTVTTGLLLMIVVAVMGTAMGMMLAPLKSYINNIKNGEKLKEKGCSEFRYFAYAYNKVSEVRELSRIALRHEAEHDGLTGLLNRGYFGKVCIQLKQVHNPLALILLDLDSFKGINDRYGHEMGDIVLKELSELLMMSFRSNDYCFRIGGDEFAIIMTNITEQEKSIIEKKISGINNAMLNPQNDAVKASISAGVAFSTDGYSEELYKMADSALYMTKKNGKSGINFYVQ